jgi:hypothetical protein
MRGEGKAAGGAKNKKAAKVEDPAQIAKEKEAAL